MTGYGTICTVPGSSFLVPLRVIVVAIAHKARRQEQFRLARVRECAVVVVEENVERDEQCPRGVQQVLHEKHIQKKKKRNHARDHRNDDNVE